MTDVVQFISVDLCRPSPTARPVQPIRVEILARSIAEVGLRQPINVRPLPDGYEIRGGGHRHAAYVSLGRDTIPAFVRTDDDLHAELAEIDENLIRNELSPAERAISIARRKAIYEELHPETAHGAIGGGHDQSRQVGDSASKAPRFTKDTAKNIGTSERTVQRDAGRGEAISEEHLRAVTGTSLDKGEELDALAKLPEDKRAAIIDRAVSGEKVSAKGAAKKDARSEKERKLGEVQAPTGKFGVIVEDFEWDHVVWSRETGMDRHAGNHYPVSDDAHTAEEIVKKTADRFAVAADNCALFMWSTVQHVAVAIDVLRQRGFTYASHYIWGKDKIGLGYWNRNKHEVLLIGVKGNIPCPAPGDQWDSLQMAPRGEHSEKPDLFLEMIEGYYPTLPKIELNARRVRKGWKAWGLEAPESESAGEATAEPATPATEIDNRDEAERPVDDLRNEGGGHVDAPTSAVRTSIETTGTGEGATDPVPVRDDDIGEIPDHIRRRSLTKNELALLNRISLEDCDKSEQVFIAILRKEPSLATVANQKRLLKIAEKQGLMAEEGI